MVADVAFASMPKMLNSDHADQAIKERDSAIAEANKAYEYTLIAPIVSEVRALAIACGAHDPNDVVRFIDVSALDGSIVGVREAIDKLVESKPYLFNTSHATNKDGKKIVAPGDTTPNRGVDAASTWSAEKLERRWREVA